MLIVVRVKMIQLTSYPCYVKQKTILTFLDFIEMFVIWRSQGLMPIFIYLKLWLSIILLSIPSTSPAFQLFVSQDNGKEGQKIVLDHLKLRPKQD